MRIMSSLPDEYTQTLSCPCCSVSMYTKPSWLSRYLALYRTKSGTRLSDVNIAESDWMDIFYKHGNMETKAKELGPWFAMTGIRPTKVFLFHELCWSRLLRHFEGENIDLDKLFEVCHNRFLHISGYFFRKYDVHNRQPRIPRPEYLTSGPPPPLLIDRVLACAERIIQIPKLPHLIFPTRGSPSTDCFCSLPPEINLQIAIYLDTVSFLDLRYVSRAMANVFYLQSFWKSRFQLNQDRGYLQCLTDSPQNEETDWRLIYRRTADLKSFRRSEEPDPEVLQHVKSLEHLSVMKELWMQAKWLRERCAMTQASKRHISRYENFLTDPQLCWKELLVGFQCDRDTRQEKKQIKNMLTCDHCLTEHIHPVQAIPLRDSTIGLAVSVLRERMTTVITGFELLSGDGRIPNLTFGYRNPGRQVTIDLRDKTLTGFTILSSTGHIHALLPIFSDKNIHFGWIGQPTVCEDHAVGSFEPKRIGVHEPEPKICKGSLNPSRELCTSHNCYQGPVRRVTDICLDRGITAFRGRFDVRQSHLNIVNTWHS